MKFNVKLRVEIEVAVEADTFEAAIAAASAVDQHDISYLVSLADKVAIGHTLYDVPAETPTQLRAEVCARGGWVLV